MRFNTCKLTANQLKLEIYAPLKYQNAVKLLTVKSTFFQGFELYFDDSLNVFLLTDIDNHSGVDHQKDHNDKNEK